MNDVKPGEIGRLAVRGPTGCRYLADKRQTVYVRDGWNLTGDTFMQDEDGRFHFVARADDMIVSAGYNIAGPEVEAALLSHGDVAECAVVGAADVDRGEIVAAYVVLKANVSGDELCRKRLQDHVKSVIAPYKYPRVVNFVDALPKTLTGRSSASDFATNRHFMDENDFVILQPANWSTPRGYANGVVAKGKQVFMAGQIGWNEQAEASERRFSRPG